MIKFVKNDEQHRYRLDAFESVLLFWLREPKDFKEVCQIEYRYLDGSFPDESDVALALIRLLEKGLITLILDE